MNDYEILSRPPHVAAGDCDKACKMFGENCNKTR